MLLIDRSSYKRFATLLIFLTATALLPGALQAACDTTVQAGISALSPNGGTYLVPAGSYDICSTIVISNSNVQLIGAGAGATQLIADPVLGTEPVLVVDGPSNALVANVTIQALTVDIGYNVSTPLPCSTNNPQNGIGVVNTFWLTLMDVEVLTRRGGCTTNTGQTAIILQGVGSGHPNFTAYTMAVNLRIRGDFLRGVWILGDGTNAGTGAYSNTFIGGAVGNTVNSNGSPATGTYGMMILAGDTNKIYNTDFEGWDHGIDVGDVGNPGAANNNGPLAARFENDNYAFEVNTGTVSTSFVGAGLGAFIDNGLYTSYASSAYGVKISTQIPTVEPIATNSNVAGFLLGNSTGSGQSCAITVGNSSPAGRVTGNPCDLYLNTAGGGTTTLWVKESGTGNTAGWIGK